MNILQVATYDVIDNLHLMTLHTPYIAFFHRVHINHLCTLSTKLAKCSGSDFII